MMVDTAMKFLGKGSGQTSNCDDTLEVLGHIQRFLCQTHYLVQDLKMRYIKQALELDGGDEKIEICMILDKRKVCKQI